MTADPSVARAGLAYGLAAFIVWGLMPLYFKSVAHVSPWEVLAARVVCTLILLLPILTAFGLWPAVRRCLADPVVRGRLVLSSVLIAANWFTYIFGVTHDRIAETSLGYYLLPLVNVALGVAVFGERLRPAQTAALVLASVGVVSEFVALGDRVPWIGLMLAGSFAVYGLIRKAVPVDGLSGLTVETVLLSPVAAAYLAWLVWNGEMTFGAVGWRTDALLAFSGVVTAVPLVCFAQAARRLPLTTMGFLQYISPTMQLILAVAVYGEPFTAQRQLSFGWIWAGLAVYSLDAAWNARRGSTGERGTR